MGLFWTQHTAGFEMLILGLQRHVLWILRRVLTIYWIRDIRLRLWLKSGFVVVCLQCFWLFSGFFFVMKSSDLNYEWRYVKSHYPQCTPVHNNDFWRAIATREICDIWSRGMSRCRRYCFWDIGKERGQILLFYIVFNNNNNNNKTILI